MTFGKRETYGYSLSGREYRIAQGESYTAVNETYRKSLARILSGSNGSTATDSASRPLTKLLNTGWTKKPGEVRGIASDVFTLWGMSDFGADHSDTYVLSMSYDPRIHLHVGRFDKSARLCSRRWRRTSGGIGSAQNRPRWKATSRQEEVCRGSLESELRPRHLRGGPFHAHGLGGPF